MAHFAQLDENDVVTQVIVINNQEMMANGVESEATGFAFCYSLYGGNWRQTSYNGKFRKNFAGPGFKYDRERDAFIPPRPYPSWTLNEETCRWQAPALMPDDGNSYNWDEDNQTWVEVANV